MCSDLTDLINVFLIPQLLFSKENAFGNSKYFKLIRFESRQTFHVTCNDDEVNLDIDYDIDIWHRRSTLILTLTFNINI